MPSHTGTMNGPTPERAIHPDIGPPYSGKRFVWHVNKLGDSSEVYLTDDLTGDFSLWPGNVASNPIAAAAVRRWIELQVSKGRAAT